MDIWSKGKRSEVMSKIGSKDTRPEIILRSLLHKEGYRFRIHRKDLPGHPDIVFPKQRLAIFVHGCFWHYHKDCKEGRIPKSNSYFWQRKLQNNIERDKSNFLKLKQAGWEVVVVWECELEKNPNSQIRIIESYLYDML